MRFFILLGLLALFLQRSAPAQSLLLLPLENESEGENYDWIGECIPDGIGAALDDTSIRTINRSQRMAAYGRLALAPQLPFTMASAIKLGQTLDATWVGVGAFRVEEPEKGAKESRHLTVRLRLLDLAALQEKAVLEESGPLESLAAIQNELAWKVELALNSGTQRRPEALRAGQRTARLDALENYYRGLTATSDEERHRLFAHSARLDEKYGEPRFQLGKIHFARRNYRVAGEWLEGLSPEMRGYREAQFLLGICLFHIGQFEESLAAFRKVEREIPVNEVLNNVAAVESRLGRSEAVGTLRILVERDSRHPTYRFNLGYALWQQNQFDGAGGEFREVLKIAPEDAEAKLLLDRCEKQIGPRPRDPRSKGLERLMETFPERAYQDLVNLLQKRKAGSSR